MNTVVIDKSLIPGSFCGVVKEMVQKGSALVNLDDEEIKTKNLYSFELNESNTLWYCANLKIDNLFFPNEEKQNKKIRAIIWLDILSGKVLGCCVIVGFVNSSAVNCSLKRSIEKNGIPKNVSIDFVKYIKPACSNDDLFQETFTNKQLANHKFLFGLYDIKLIETPIFLYTKAINRFQNFIDFIHKDTLHSSIKEIKNFKKTMRRGVSQVKKKLEFFIEKFNQQPNNDLPEKLSPNDYHQRNLKEIKNTDIKNLNCLIMWFYSSFKGNNNTLNFFGEKVEDYRLNIREINKIYECGIKNSRGVIVCQIFSDEPEIVYLLDLAGGFLGSGKLIKKNDKLDTSIIEEAEYKNYGTSEKPVVSIADAAKLENISSSGMNKKIKRLQLGAIQINAKKVNPNIPRGVFVSELSKKAQSEYYESLKED